jgi:hypothetical protein
MRERQAGRSSNAVCGLAAVFRANQNENSTVKRVLGACFSPLTRGAKGVYHSIS